MKFIKKTKEIKIGDNKITVKKLSLEKIGEILEKITIPEEVAKMDKTSDNKIMQTLPLLIARFMPHFAEGMVVALDNQVSKDDLLKEMGLTESLILVKGVLEVNDIQEVFLLLGSIREMVKNKK